VEIGMMNLMMTSWTRLPILSNSMRLVRRQMQGGISMRFMMLMIPKGYDNAVPGAMPDAKAVAAMMKYNESLQKAGVLLALDGLHPPSMGARVSFSGGKPKVTTGLSSRRSRWLAATG
jgi:hypothetical protein